MELSGVRNVARSILTREGYDEKQEQSSITKAKEDYSRSEKNYWPTQLIITKFKKLSSVNSEI